MTSAEMVAFFILLIAGLAAFEGHYGWATLWILLAIGVIA